MKYRTLGRTGLKMPLMGLGTGGRVDPLGQASGRPEKDAHALIHRAYDLGINYFDTAPGYMESEAILGRAIQSLPRDKVVVSTKIALAGSMPGKPLTTMLAKEITEAVEQSLKRMQVEYIDLMLMGVAGPQYIDRVMDVQLPELIKLKEQGKIRFLGSSEQTRSDGEHQWLQMILPLDVLDVVMVGHNLINQSAQRSLFPICQQQNVGVINVFTVRRTFADKNRLKEVVSDLQHRNIVGQDGIDREAPLDWLMKDGEVDSVIEACYRYAAYTDGVTTVMNGAHDIGWMEENVRSVLKGPLSEHKRKKLQDIFGKVAEAIGN